MMLHPSLVEDLPELEELKLTIRRALERLIEEHRRPPSTARDRGELAIGRHLDVLSAQIVTYLSGKTTGIPFGEGSCTIILRIGDAEILHLRVELERVSQA